MSPDGRSLAFVRYERPGIGDVYVAPIAGGDARRRTNWNTEISGVAWTPDGRDIVCAVLEEPGLDQTLFGCQPSESDSTGASGAARECGEPIDVQAATR